jgi:phosphate transport system permease protein
MAVSAPPVATTERKKPTYSRGDNVFIAITVTFAVLIIVLVVMFAFVLLTSSWESIQKNGFNFYTSINWTVSQNEVSFGALNFIFASLVTSGIALLIGGTISIGAAIFLAEYAPGWLRAPLAFTIELLAAIPSIIYGFWGVQVLSPILGGPNGVEAFLNRIFGSFIPMFSNRVTNVYGREQTVTFTGRDLLCAGLILSIMIIPIVSSITRDVIRTVPDSQREGMLAMGATKWQAISKAVLPYGRSGIVGAIILGLGRAIGETVAVAYLIGGASTVIGPNSSLFVPNETLPAKISNAYGEITPDTQSAIIQLGLTLFVITLIVNIIARYLVSQSAKRRTVKKGGLNTVLSYAGKVVFPAIVLVAGFFISFPIAIAIIGIWAAVKLLRAAEVRLSTQGKALPNFLGFFANPNRSYLYRKSQDRTMRVLVALAALVAIIPLASILILVTVNGAPQIFKEGFLTGNQRTAPFGIGHAILGTLIMTGIGTVIGVPIGILAGIYLSEFGKGKFAAFVRTTADVLQGIPSIIMGIVVYTVFVQTRVFSAPNLTSPYNGIAGGLALGIMIIPIVTRNTEEILRLVPVNIREASLALGVPQWRTTVTVIIPAAFSGVITGVILGVARIAGETAPLLFTARGNSFFPSTLQGETPAITLFIFQQQTAALQQEQIDLLWGAAFTLVFMILIMTLVVRFLTRNKLGTKLSN